MDDDIFNKVKADGSPLLCKFCKNPVWYHKINSSPYEVGGKELHVDNCPARRTHYKNLAFDGAELDRGKRSIK